MYISGFLGFALHPSFFNDSYTFIINNPHALQQLRAENIDPSNRLQQSSPLYWRAMGYTRSSRQNASILPHLQRPEKRLHGPRFLKKGLHSSQRNMVYQSHRLIGVLDNLPFPYCIPGFGLTDMEWTKSNTPEDHPQSLLHPIEGKRRSKTRYSHRIGASLGLHRYLSAFNLMLLKVDGNRD